jgi:hypothetical protein
MPTFNTQFHLLGVYCEIEVDYTVDPADPSVGLNETAHLQSVYILGIYPEGCESRAVRTRDYVYLNAKADLGYLTLEEMNTLENECYEHLEARKQEAFDYE